LCKCCEIRLLSMVLLADRVRRLLGALQLRVYLLVGVW